MEPDGFDDLAVICENYINRVTVEKLPTGFTKLTFDDSVLLVKRGMIIKADTGHYISFDEADNTLIDLGWEYNKNYHYGFSFYYKNSEVSK